MKLLHRVPWPVLVYAGASAAALAISGLLWMLEG